MMFSSSYNSAFREHGDGMYYFNRQLIFALIGVVTMAIFSMIDYRIWKTKLMILGCTALAAGMLVCVKLGIGSVTQGNAERWLSIGGITFQPSELAKFAVILLLAWWGSKIKPEQPAVQVKYRGGSLLYYAYLKFVCMPVRYGFGFAVLVLCGACGLTVIQPHLSATIIIGVIGMSIIFVSGTKKSNIFKFLFIMIAAAALVVIYMKAAGYTYIDKRVTSFLNPESDTQGDTFQTYNSLLAIGSGGFWGVGLGKSHQKYGFLPASQNDFIFPVICEELGFIGALFVIILFLIFIGRGLYIASKSQDKFGMLLATGIVVQLGFQAFLNIAVATNAFFNTGVSLPFFSYGGTALIMQLAQVGILLNVSWYANRD
jgi:cell division protein FtsW